MANEQNLNPFGTLTESEQREISSKGGKASGEARRNKKILRDCLEMLLEKEITDKSGNTMTGAEVMAVKVFQQALKGDLKAFEIVRDTAGQKPVEKVVISEIDTDVIDEVERMVNDDEKTSG
jgi:hypothetical protein